MSVKFGTKSFRKLFLLRFTRELIMNSSSSQVFKLQKILEEEGIGKEPGKQIKEKIQEVIKAKEMEVSILSKRRDEIEKGKIPFIKRKSFPFESFKEVRLTIPETRLPPRFDYLRPVPMEHKVDLGKLNPLLSDPFVKIIECNGANENIIVKGNMGEKKTGIILDKEEINNLINIFSKETRIPIQEGIYKVVLGRLIFLAIISEVVGSKFIIKKMAFRR